MSQLNQREVKYLNKDFGQFRKNLIDFSKNYFPNTYNDFNESSPGMMFIELASYVGDVLSFYTDYQLKESLIHQASERGNVYALAATLGYKPSNSIPASTTLDMFQLIPSKGSGSGIRPDFSYALQINENMIVRSRTNSSIEFRTIEPIDFSYSSSLSPTIITVYEIDESTNEPVFYLLQKFVKATAGKIESETFEFDSPKIYDKFTLSEDNVIEVLDVIDSDNNIWYEVPYLAQDTLFQTLQNIRKNDPDLYRYRDSAPYLLKLKKTARRFITRTTDDGKLELQFGAGISDNADEELIPNPDLIGSSLPGLSRTIDLNIDPSNFLYTKTYGLAPSNTTLTVRYSVGGGVASNVPSGDLTDIANIPFNLQTSGLDLTLLNRIKASIACTNPKPATGGKSRETLTEIQNNSLASFAAQNRAVTKEDYIIRAYSMPSRYGAVAKAYIVQDDQLGTVPGERIPNPLALNLYTLGYDNSNNLTTLNDAVKENLKTYLSYYRILTDAVNIKDAFIINIGINFEVITLPDYNSNEVLLRCVDKMKSIFDNKKWQINQPIVLSKLYTELDKVEGVQTVTNVEVINLYDENQNYSGNIYDIKAATKDGIIFPSMDPSCFEVKYLNSDIKGRVVSL